MQNNFNQGFNGGYNMNPGGFPQPGFQYNNQRPVPKMTQTLTADQIKELRSSGATFDLNISQMDMWKAICTHKENGKIALVENSDGTVTCPICGATFKMTAADQETVNEAVRLIMDLLQSAKTMYLDISADVAAQYFQFIPILEKLPQLYQIATSNFAKYDNSNNMMQSGSMYGFGALSALTSPMYGSGMPMMNQGGYYQPQQPMMMNQGYYQPQPQQQMVGENPFGYNYGQPMMQPQMPQQQVAPQQMQQMQQQQQAPQAQPQPQQGKNDQVVNSAVFNV